MACTPAPACVAVRKQATKLWPARSQASDGICASSTHTTQNPGSDHEPHVVLNGVAYATAVDLTDDKAHGCDADEWAEFLRRVRDPRVKYVICNQRMFSSYAVQGIPPWTWRTYKGANPHEKHTHLSIVPEAVHVVGPWFPQLVSIDPGTPSEDDLMRFPDHGYLPVVIEANGKGRAEIPVPFDKVVSVSVKANDKDGSLPKVSVGFVADPYDLSKTVVLAEGHPGTVGVVVGVVR